MIYVVLDCGDPGAPLHGRRHGSRFTYAEKVWFSCHHLTTLVGTRTISCNEHGKWSNPRPICRSTYVGLCVCLYVLVCVLSLLPMLIYILLMGDVNPYIGFT